MSHVIKLHGLNYVLYVVFFLNRTVINILNREYYLYFLPIEAAVKVLGLGMSRVAS